MPAPPVSWTGFNGTPLTVQSTSALDTDAAIRASKTVASGAALSGRHTATTGTSHGVFGETLSASGSGVRGKAPTGGFAVFADGALHVVGPASIVGNVTITGDMSASGAKNFVQPHPADPALAIQFVCLEGNENGTYFRGTTRLVQGQAELAIPPEWTLVTEEAGITVQLTPLRSFARLAVFEVGRERIVVRGTEDCEFSYLVNGVRRGFAEHRPFVPNELFRPHVAGVPFGGHLPRGVRDLLVANGILDADYTPNLRTAARLGWRLLESPDPAGCTGVDGAPGPAVAAAGGNGRQP